MRDNRGTCGALAAVVLLLGLGQAFAADEGQPRPKAPTGQKISLKLKLTAGAKQNLFTSTEEKIDQELLGMKQTIDQVIGFGWTQEVQSVDDQGNATVRQTYTSSRMKSAGAGQNVDFDSAKGGNAAPEAAPYATIVGLSFTFKISPQGKVLSVSGADQIVETLIKAVNAQEPLKTIIIQQVRLQFSEAALKEQIEAVYAIYPDRPVDNGDTWKRTTTMTSAFNATTENSFTLLEHVGGKATVAFKGTIDTKDSKPIEMNLVKVTPQLTGTQTGIIVIDEATGLPSQSHAKMEMKGAMVADALGLPAPQTIPMTISGTTTTEAK